MNRKEKGQYLMAGIGLLLYVLAVDTAGYPEVQYISTPQSSSIELYQLKLAEGRAMYQSNLTYEERAAQERLPYGYYDWSLYNSSWAAEMQSRINAVRKEEQDNALREWTPSS